jgi:hypothetical protein
VAYIIKGGDGVSRRHSLLSKAGPDSMAAFQRQRDTYLLAKMGNRDCRRLWNDFVQDDPSMARLVVADVEQERAEGAKVSEAIDERLRAAELVTKDRKSKVAKSRKRAPAVSRSDPFSPAALVNSTTDPTMREMARAVLNG